MKLTQENCDVEQDEMYFRVIVRFGTHKLHSEKLNLQTSIALRDELIND